MQKIQINLLPATDKEKSLEIDLRHELHLMLAGLSGIEREIILDTISEQLQAIPDTDVKKIDLTEEIAECQLKSIFQELENRYRIMAGLVLRTIEDYNQTSDNNWHYIVVLINYHPVGGEIDFLICKLAQKGRAAGIHLILESSKTPSSRICVNFPARLIGSGTLEMAKGNRFAENEAGLFYFCGKKCEKVKLL